MGSGGVEAPSRTVESDTESSDVIKKPIAAPTLPLFQRLTFAARLWAFKCFVSIALRALYTFKRTEFAQIAPSCEKIYPVRPTLANRIFLPSTYNPKSSTRYPLYIDIHGGGFALCDPQTDDRFCHHLANANNFLVVSINYRKAPTHPYPIPVEDCLAIALAVLADKDLPINHSHVCVGGFSAGGNLALAISQHESLRTQIHACVPVYPVVDFSGVYTGKYRTTKSGKKDMLESSSKLFNWGYINPGTDRTSPTLSPIYAARETLPDRLFFIGAEYDVLCHEAEVMARKLAGLPPIDAEGGPPSSEPSMWERNGVKWMMLRDVQHGYTHTTATGEEEVVRKGATDETYAEIGRWLREDVGFKEV